MRVLVFGDSIAQGFWSVKGGWAERLRKHYDSLALKNLKAHHEPEIFNLGVSGDTTRNLLARVELEASVRKWPGNPLYAVLAIGTNDELFENNQQLVPPEEFEKNINRLIKILTPITDGIMFVGNAACDESQTTPVFWANIHYTNRQMHEYENIIGKICAGKQILFVPVFEKFQAAMASQELLADGLHPNDAGHQLIFELVQPELDKLIHSK